MDSAKQSLFFSFFGFTKYNLYKYTHLNNIYSYKLIILYGVIFHIVSAMILVEMYSSMVRPLFCSNWSALNTFESAFFFNCLDLPPHHIKNFQSVPNVLRTGRASILASRIGLAIFHVFLKQVAGLQVFM